jgi:hypothetical protein
MGDPQLEPLMGALTGLVLDIAQAIALPRETRLRRAWAQ